tara:strand:+ start:208 stop:522 length:315 start_codon:yes stop_codon:yes gene_type:complete
MKKIILVISIFILILITSLVKNSTKKIEDKIFTIKENVSSLRAEFGNVMLEYNFLSSPEKLTQYQLQYFNNDFIEMDINKIKKIYTNTNYLEITDFIKKTKNNE